jgi:hypothetical protein
MRPGSWCLDGGPGILTLIALGRNEALRFGPTQAKCSRFLRCQFDERPMSAGSTAVIVGQRLVSAG